MRKHRFVVEFTDQKGQLSTKDLAYNVEQALRICINQNIAGERRFRPRNILVSTIRVKTLGRVLAALRLKQ